MDWFVYDNGLRHERVKRLVGSERKRLSRNRLLVKVLIWCASDVNNKHEY